MADAINAQESFSHVAFLVWLLVSAVLSAPFIDSFPQVHIYVVCVFLHLWASPVALL